MQTSSRSRNSIRLFNIESMVKVRNLPEQTKFNDNRILILSASSVNLWKEARWRYPYIFFSTKKCLNLFQPKTEYHKFMKNMDHTKLDLKGCRKSKLLSICKLMISISRNIYVRVFIEVYMCFIIMEISCLCYFESLPYAIVHIIFCFWHIH